uniref:Ion-translocating oxidoreductase complex subunit C n=1 Tax=candidate division WOR-3 bacterium TaxID=2052148 RepID=A0A7C4YA92_UNCW3
MKTLRFKGGIHPEGHKELTKSKEIVKVKPPQEVYIPLSQHTGAPSKPLVKKKDKVKVGTRLSEPNGFVSVPIHSPVSGIVDGIVNVYHCSGRKVEAVKIITEGEELEEGVGVERDISSLKKEELIEKIKMSGIVGLGGAAFPTHVKLSPPPDKKIDTVIINGAECEPYLTADHRIMLEKKKEIFGGIEVIRKILNPEKVIIGIEDNKIDAYENLVKYKDKDVEIALLRTWYPQGGEKQLIYALTGRVVPAGGLPFDVGCYVQNVGTVVAIYEALRFGKPLYERVITITGGVEERGNYLVPIGTPVKYLLEIVKPKGNIGKIILGGPMTGISIISDEVPVIKGTSGIIVQLEKEVFTDEQYPCIRCSSCVDTCPMSLMPTELEKLVGNGKYEEAEKMGIMFCIECGCCSYVCPSRRPLVHSIKVGKREILKRRKK